MKSIKIRDGEPCPKCGLPMSRMIHPKISEKILNKNYYFSEWDKCKPCRHIQFYEKFKVYPNTTKGREFREYENFRKEQPSLNWIK